MTRPPRAVLVVAALLVTLLVVATVVRSCAGPSTTIQVYADSSLRHAFTDLGRAFEEEQDVAIDLTVDSSGNLVRDLTAGDSPDVFAAADPVGLVQVNGVVAGEPAVIAEDRLVIAVPKGNPGDVERVADLDGDEVAVCYINESCGRLAQLALDSAGIEVQQVVGADSAETVAEVVDGRVEALGSCSPRRPPDAEDSVETIELPVGEPPVAFPSISPDRRRPPPGRGPGVHRLRPR